MKALFSDDPFSLSDWCIARQPRDTIEVSVITGEVGQTMGLHDRDDQGVTHEQFVLLADQSRGLDKQRGDCGDLDSQERGIRAMASTCTFSLGISA